MVFSLKFYADSRSEGVTFQLLSASRLSDNFFMRLSVGSVIFISVAFLVQGLGNTRFFRKILPTCGDFSENSLQLDLVFLSRPRKHLST
jgi:hypothetical protein